MLKLNFDSNITTNISRAKSLEWLESNGLGGYAHSTISCANTRRYHGLLVSAVKPPTERMVMLSKLDETVITASSSTELATNFYPGAIHPRGYYYISSFERDLFPTWHYEVNGIKITKIIGMVQGQDLVIIKYIVDKAPTPFTLALRPFVACRRHHSLTHFNNSINQNAIFKGDTLVMKPYVGVPGLSILAPAAHYDASPQWYHNFEYDAEKERGFDYQEDLFSYGVLKTELREGQSFSIIASTTHPLGLDADRLLENERKRRLNLFKDLKVRGDFAESLTLAADQFIVARGNSGKTILAGYPWFTDWGRDTMISLPGLCLTTGRFKDAQRIINQFANLISEGMIPNRFPDEGHAPEYNTVDATLWFFVAAYQYALTTRDYEFIRKDIVPRLFEILDWHYRGTRYQIKVDNDGLLVAGDKDSQLTWMDARSNGIPVTPRHGKAVEVNALWYNAHLILAELCGERARAKDLKAKAKIIKDSFLNQFWNSDQKCLYDLITDGKADSTIRPNQIFVLSLPFSILSNTQAKQVLDCCSQALATPCGLRSLAPTEKNYHSQYEGNPSERDNAYHQGTVWGYLVGPYVIAQLKYGGRNGKFNARVAVKELERLLFEGCVGTIAEIFDGDLPHLPRGCLAQAWSVAEALRALAEVER